jgi:STAM-binding protein
MNGSGTPRPSRPYSVQEITELADKFDFRTSVPFKHWARAAETLYQEVGGS